MADSNASPRQKMINLMYLVFISMIAMSVSNEVLQGFGVINEKIEKANTLIYERNKQAVENLNQKAVDQPQKYLPIKESTDRVVSYVSEFYGFLEDLKKGFISSATSDPKNYSAMNKSDYFDHKLFLGQNLTETARNFMSYMEGMRSLADQVLSGTVDEGLLEDLRNTFNTDPIIDNEGLKMDWMIYQFEGAPGITSVTKMTQIQYDILEFESRILSTLVQDQLVSDVSVKNYEAIVIPEKMVYFPGEIYQGKVILGRKDKTHKPLRVVVNGKKVPESFIQEGQVILSFNTGNELGERSIGGQMVFLENNKEVAIPVSANYKVVKRAYSSVVSADKMNVVYRGIENPITVSWPGVPDSNISVKAEGIKKIKGVGKYMLKPGKGKVLTLNILARLPDGTVGKDQKKFRIKDIPAPTGAVRGQSGSVKMSKSSLAISTVSAYFPDFDFDLKLNVKGFKLKMPNQPTLIIQGIKLDSKAVSALARVRVGEVIQIFDIEIELEGNTSYKLKKVSPLLIHITS